MFYLVKTPSLLKKIYPDCTWNFSRNEQVIYLTFDDGPHITATPFVLDTLKKFNAKATFFCIGKNVAAHPDIYKRIIIEEHTTGNHTFNHLSGWKSTDEEYIQNIKEAGKYIDSKLFRPPYGKITKFQVKLLKPHFRVVMWDVLSADFDLSIDGNKCMTNVTRNAGNGSVVVFHDSEKAFPRLEKALPEILAWFADKGFRFESIKG